MDFSFTRKLVKALIATSDRPAVGGPACRHQAHMTSSGTWPLASPCHFL